MSYRLALARSVPVELKEVATEQVDKAIDNLLQDDPHEAVHDVRKRCKKVGAVLRLARDAMGKPAYSDENVRYRDAARAISALRDGQAMIETLDQITRTAGLDDGSLEPLRRALLDRRDGLLAQARANGTLQELVAMLESARDDIPAWPIAGTGFDAIGDGLARVYGRGRRGHRAVRESPDAERLHDWRKRVKYLWYHARLLQPVWPDAMDALRTALDDLGDLLGDDHDVVVLERHLDQQSVPGLDTAARHALRAAMAQRRVQCQNGIWYLAECVYAEDERDFVSRIGSYWRAATHHLA